MSLFDEMNADIAAVLVEFGKAVELNGTTYLAFVAENPLAVEMKPAAFAEASVFQVKLLRTDLPNIPKHGDVVRYNNADYRVSKVTDRPPHPMVILEITL